MAHAIDTVHPGVQEDNDDEVNLFGFRIHVTGFTAELRCMLTHLEVDDESHKSVELVNLQVYGIVARTE